MKSNIFAILFGFCYVIVNIRADLDNLNQNNSSLIAKNSNGSNIHKNNFFSATSNLFQSFYEKLSTLKYYYISF
jgi:hypothetical protein